MNLFQSEEHIRNWQSFAEGTDEGILTLPDLVKLFTGPFFQRRMDEDYLSRMHEYLGGMIQVMKALGKTGPFWKKPKK
ncbi:MAG TPA: hypothetical protein PLR20_14110 [Syntrophales bacterium]|nr:hypothetical protein [Syntrophales bacterium]HQM30480.1 hypothetical protein [Syntrophales bacterium]